ncbi:MAG: alpha/beta fold hydrolase [Roseomonas sp.]
MQHFSIKGYDMAFIAEGQGHPLLLIHGSLYDHRYWAPQTEILAAAGFRVFVPSLRHYWPNDASGAAGLSVEEHIEDLMAFIAGLQLGPIDLLGHSRGGYIAFRIAERHPELLRRLVLAEPAGVLGAGFIAPGEAMPNYTGLIADSVTKVASGEIEAGLASFYEYALGPGSWAKLGETRQSICRDNARTLIGQGQEGRVPYTRASAEALSPRMLLIDGALAEAPFRRVADGLARTIPHLKRVTLPSAAHLLNWDDAAGFNASVLEFLRAP